MKRFRITKYNPSFRNEIGEYLPDEWTSIYDIGKAFNKEILTESEYIKKEKSYLQVILLLLNDSNIHQMRIKELEKYSVENLSNSIPQDDWFLIENINVGKIVGISEIIMLSRMTLREFIWAKFEALDKKFVLEFGYDYYMYVLCEKICDKRKEDILKLGLFVEEIEEV